ncbi:alpha-ketoglutarate-dependent dioxygenase alkB homolog 7, mitochondrial-like isoform X2 [Hydra vulgaris]|uniref:Alpha-ketoglutarate-dependent dioxygenase alkB homolog 7, mitochondrial-like isoform X2 n=1 Tax=Hydra vulgaris TaxID=6087 RepID=A0ABM4C750_HYDVU
MKLLRFPLTTECFCLLKSRIRFKSDVVEIPNTAFKFSVIKANNSIETSKIEQVLQNCLKIYERFITEEEENHFEKEVSLSFRRKKYEYGHWDGAIEGFREVEKTIWSKECQLILDRIANKVFGDDIDSMQPFTHVLDLAKNGYIKPHTDSVKFCGSKIAGLCLLSSAVMRFVNSSNSELSIDVLMPRYCLYVMRTCRRWFQTVISTFLIGHTLGVHL